MDIVDEMIKDIETYTIEKQEKIRRAVKTNANLMKIDIQAVSPVRDSSKKNYSDNPAGSYKKGWRVKVLRDDGGRYLLAVAQTGKLKGLPHLIDLGHDIVAHGKKYKLNKNGKYIRQHADGEKVGTAKAIPHINVKQRYYTDKLHREIEEILKD